MDSPETQVTRRTELLSINLESDALLDEVAASLVTARRLLSYLEGSPGRDLEPLRADAQRIEQRLGRRELVLALVGVPGSGKRTLLEALIGDQRLGQARGTAGMPTFIRNRATPRYRAKFTDGSVVDFAQLIPDRSREHDQRLTGAEAAYLEAEQAHAALAARARTAEEALGRAREELGRFARAVASAQEVEAAIGADLSSADAAKDQATRTLVLAERPIPVRLRKAPERMGWLLRIWRALFVLFRRPLWQAYLQARQALRAAEERLAGMRERALSSARERQEAAALLAAPQAVAEARRNELDVAERAAADARAELESARSLMEQRRAELARYVEERWAAFFDGLQQLSDESGGPADVVEVAVDYPARHLPEDIAIIDVPEHADAARSERSRSLVREEADAFVLAWDVEKPVQGSTREFWNGARDVVPHLLLLLTKMDATFLDAVRAGHSEPWAHVDDARRAAAARLAEDLGEEPERLLSVAVAAQAAVEDPDSGLARRFPLETTKLFQLVRQERAVSMGTRSAELVETCIGLARGAEQRAAKAYRERVAELAARRVPEPEAFHRQTLEQAGPVVEAAVARVIETAAADVRRRCAALSEMIGRASESEPGGSRSLLEAERALAAGVKSMQESALSTLELGLAGALEALEGRVFAELQRRYGVEGVRTLRTAPPRFDPAPIRVGSLSEPRVPKHISSFRRLRFALGLLGLALGAALGAAGQSALGSWVPGSVPPWVGGISGAFAGLLLGFAKSWSSVEQTALAELRQRLGEQEQSFISAVSGLAPSLAVVLREELDGSVEQVIIRHGRSMTAPVEAAEEAINRERSNLGELRELGEILERHDERLRALGGEAAAVSTELCR